MSQSVHSFVTFSYGWTPIFIIHSSLLLLPINNIMINKPQTRLAMVTILQHTDKQDHSMYDVFHLCHHRCCCERVKSKGKQRMTKPEMEMCETDSSLADSHTRYTDDMYIKRIVPHFIAEISNCMDSNIF